MEFANDLPMWFVIMRNSSGSLRERTWADSAVNTDFRNFRSMWGALLEGSLFGNIGHNTGKHTQGFQWQIALQTVQTYQRLPINN